MIASRHRGARALSRTVAMFIKEFVQLRRDRLTFATMIFIPVVQLLLFGYAINTTPRHLPTAVLVHEDSDLARSDPGGAQQHLLLHGHQARPLRSRDGSLDALRRGAVRRRDPRRLRAQRAARRPAGAAGGGRRQRSGRRRHGARRAGRHRAARRWRATAACPRPPQQPAAFEIRQHRRYNPAAVTSLNIVPGLLGTILTMTMLIFTALSVTREVERGTMESLLAMPIKPLEIMLGKIAPYIVIGFIQAALIIAVRHRRCSRCRSTGSMLLLARCQHALHRHQPVDRLHLLDHRPEPAAGDPDVVHVLPAQHPAVGLHVSVRGHAALGASGSARCCPSRTTSASCAASC